ncbi:MAG: hypothetical protein JNK15_25010 [Planctomycetes bacterium]|nr:hypothetical protein [Planctomycetota bacterium]
MRHRLLRAAAWVAAGSALAAQDPTAPTRVPAPESPFTFRGGNLQSLRPRGDYREAHVFGGFLLRVPGVRLEVRGTNALLLTDMDATEALRGDTGNGAPRRGMDLPQPRRRLSNDEIRDRMARTLAAFEGSDPRRVDTIDDRMLEAIRYLYCEGGVVVVRDGVEVLRCDRLWISPIDDRIVVENAELRYRTPGRGADDTLVVRGPRLVKQGGRWTGRDVTMTTCTAAEPHYAVAVGEFELIERDGEFEVYSRGQSLQLHGTSVLPLPDAHFFTGSQGDFPIKRVRGGYSSKDGALGEVVFGLPWNGTGGSLHHAITGRPAHEFRGDWELGVGYIGNRGAPLDGVLEYRAPGLYEGRTQAYWIDDRGEDRREITRHLDGTDIDSGNRGIVQTQNRLHLGPTTHLDLVAFHGSDPGVQPEFFSGAYRTEETPETSAYLHHADGNRLLTVGSRSNLSEFSYRDDRALAERFIEESPVVTYHWIAQPIGRTPWDTPVVVDLATEIGQRRSDYDDRAGFRVADRTLRADQLAEVSMPFRLGEVSIRPFVNGRGTWFDNTVDGDSEGRVALTGGVQAGTRLSRTWSWTADGEQKGMRHVVAPKIGYLDRFHVDDERTGFLQFDELDDLAEERLVRIELRNLVQTMEPTGNGASAPRDFVFLDLAQDLFPDKGRDNGGDALGLFYYDLLLRPRIRWLPFETFSYALYGDHDWEDGLRTLDTELRFGPVAGLVWSVDYRTDTNIDGAVGVGASTQLLGRWDLFAASQRDLDRDEWLAYSFGLRRNDHDWSIELVGVYNPFSDETTVRLDFLPRIGGLGGGRSARFPGFDGPDQFATSY